MTSKARNTSVGFFPKLGNFFIWLGWLAIVIPSIVFSVYRSYSDLPFYETEIDKWVYVYLNFGSFVVAVIAAIIIFRRKQKDWLAIVVSLMLVTFSSTSDGSDFWYSFINTGNFDIDFGITYFLSTSYTFLLSILLLCVLFTFPNGKWSPRWTRWFFFLSLAIMIFLPFYLVFMIFFMQGLPEQILFFLQNTLPELFRLGVLGLGALAQIYRLLVTKDQLERQQLKWIALSLVGLTFFYISYNLNVLFNFDPTPNLDLTLFFFAVFFTYGFIVTFAISALRYHIWDIDIVINKTLVYSALTTILGSLGITSAVLFELYADQYLNNSSPLIGLLAILPLIILFVPLRDSLQNFVDNHFKPEEIDFSGSIVEFAPEAQLMLTSNDILKILARQVNEQLNVTDVEIYLKHENGKLFLSEPIPDAGAVPSMLLVEKERIILEKGDVLVPADTSHYSLYLPLTLKRASKPEFLGVLALGLRENGVGYSSSVLKSLKKFGAEAGKVLYIAKLRESTGRNILERLASLEKGLINLKTDLA